MLGCHDDVGHLGLERSLDLLKDQFYWPNMAQDMETNIRQCDRYLGFKTSVHKKHKLPGNLQH